MSTSEWIDAFAEHELTAAAPRVLRKSSKRIVVFRTHGGDIFAVDDRCPHEGYPLAKGTLADCVLTCKWHNFKFDIRDGACLMGDEAVRTFPIRLRNSRVEVDISDPPPEAAAKNIWPSLEDAMLERKLGQISRHVVRLLALGIEPSQLALFAARFDARYAEWGTTHVLPLALDVLDEAERRGAIEPTAAALPLMQIFELAADAHTRRSERAKPGPIDPGSDKDAAGMRFVQAVDEEDLELAVGLVRGALARGWRRDPIESWLFVPLCAHFLDFGHPMIYQIKLFDLLERCGWEHADDLLTAHVLGIVTGTREDSLPEWSHFEKHWAEVNAQAAEMYSQAVASENHLPSAELIGALSGNRDNAFQALEAALTAGLSLRGALNAIVAAAATRILNFDPAHDASVENQHNWLDVTHTLTYASAVREALSRYSDPRLLRAIYFAVRFVNVTSALDRKGSARQDLSESESQDQSMTVQTTIHACHAWSEVFALVSKRDELAAMAAARKLLACGLVNEKDTAALIANGWDFILDDPATRPIVIAHFIKLFITALKESQATRQATPLLAAIRVLAAPIRERRVGRLTHEAIRLIAHGKVPRTLY